MIAVKRILMATDFSACSKEALDYAVFLAQKLDAEIYLLHVFEAPFFSHTGVSPSVQHEVQKWIEENKKDASKALQTLAKEIQSQGVKASAILKEGQPFLEILKAAEEIPVHLIILGTHGRTGLPHVLMGSVAERVVRKSSCPVMTIRPKALRDEVSKKS